MIQFKQTKNFSKPSLEKLLNSYAEETGFISDDKVAELLKSEDRDKLTKHLVEWNKLIENAQDNEALKKADEIRQMIRGQKEFSVSGCTEVTFKTTNPEQLTKIVKAIGEIGNPGHCFTIVLDPDNTDYKTEFTWDGDGNDFIDIDEIKEFSITCSKLRRFSDDKMLFVEYVDEDGDTTHQVMKESEFEQVKDEAKTNRTSGAKLKILTEEAYDETNPKHKKYKDHPVTETKEFATLTAHQDDREFTDREQVPQYIADEVDKNGVIVKYKDSWRIVSKKQKPYEFWDAHYDTKEDAEAALAAYHVNK